MLIITILALFPSVNSAGRFTVDRKFPNPGNHLPCESIYFRKGERKKLVPREENVRDGRPVNFVKIEQKNIISRRLASLLNVTLTTSSRIRRAILLARKN